MIDVCGFHTDPDYRDELATANAEIPSVRTVPGTIRSNRPARRVQKTRIRLLTQDGPACMRMWGRTWTSGYRAQATAF